jgi:hypothetical protein
MVMGNAFPNSNGSSAFSSWKAVSPAIVIIWNKYPHIDVSLRAETHPYANLAAIY